MKRACFGRKISDVYRMTYFSLDVLHETDLLFASSLICLWFLGFAGGSVVCFPSSTDQKQIYLVTCQYALCARIFSSFGKISFFSLFLLLSSVVFFCFVFSSSVSLRGQNKDQIRMECISKMRFQIYLSCNLLC